MTPFQRIIYDLLSAPKSDEMLLRGVVACRGMSLKQVAGGFRNATIAMYRQRLIIQRPYGIWRKTQ